MSTPMNRIRNRLSAKILIALSLCVAVVMACVIFLGVASQQRHLRNQMTTFGRELQSVAYAAIKLPMARGDSEAVQNQLLQIRDRLGKGEIVIAGFDHRIVFATHAKRRGTTLADFITNAEMLSAINRLFDEGEEPRAAFFEEYNQNRQFLLTMQGLTNEAECHHCHGSRRRMLGCLITLQDTGPTYAAIIALRNRTIVISLFGIAAIIFLTYLMLTRLVTRPVEELAVKTRQIAAGDLDASVAVQSGDSIGVLGRNFNIMAKSIKDQIGYFESLRDAIAAPLFIVDTSMVITYMNEACTRLTGFSRREVEGKLTCREVLKSDRCETNCPLAYCLEDGAMVEGITATITSRAGSTIPVMTSASALKDTGGTIIGAVLICKDISDLIEAERLRYLKATAQREEEQRHYLEERVRELLAVLSKAAGGDLRVRAPLRGGKDVMDKIAGHVNLALDELDKLYARISSFNKELEQEVDRRTLMLQEKTILLERANRELRELDKLKSAFLANMSHELRTPMNSIIGYTDLLLDGIDGAVNEEQGKSLQKVHHNARHLLQLINDILDMAKIESGKIVLSPDFIDIRTITESVATIFEPQMIKKGLRLDLDIVDELPLVYADEDKVRQIFINLLSNAMKFTDKGGITIRIRAPKPAATGVRFLEICVADTGIGIKPEDLGNLFDKFSQIDSSTVRQYEGTGLGLSIARGLVVLHKGKITVSSTFGKGTEFCFTLPCGRELFEQTGQVEIEPNIAEVLGQYFNLPAETFLERPTFGGQPIRCWEFSHCGQVSCPAYGSKEHRCWLIPFTHCKGTMVAECSEKIDFCKSCEIIDRLILSTADRRTLGARGVLPDSEGNERPAVVVIDDNPEVIELVGKYIGDEYQVKGLLSGRDALEVVGSVQPAAVILDIMMPGKDGWQVLHELKQNPATQDIPVIILSIVDNRKLGFSLGAAEYIVKPVSRDLLLRKLHSLEKIAAINKILIIDSDPRTIALLSRLLVDCGYEVEGSSGSNEAAAKLDAMRPDLIVLNPFSPEPEGANILEKIKSDEHTKNIPLILLGDQTLSPADLENLNGRIRAILDKGLLSEETLLQELVETIRKCNQP
jgi:PAS domain S-box-containing protein